MRDVNSNLFWLHQEWPDNTNRLNPVIAELRQGVHQGTAMTKRRELIYLLILLFFLFFFFFPGIRVATQIQSFHWGMKTRFQGQGQALPSIYAADLLLRRHPSVQVARLSPRSSLLMPRPLRQTQAQAPWPSCAIFAICTERGKAVMAGFREVLGRERWTQGSSACTGGTERMWLQA